MFYGVQTLFILWKINLRMQMKTGALPNETAKKKGKKAIKFLVEKWCTAMFNDRCFFFAHLHCLNIYIHYVSIWQDLSGL